MDQDKLKLLKEGMPYMWKVQTGKPGAKGGWCVAYIDARDAMDRLDATVGPENWQDGYELVGDRLVAKVGIRIGGEWVWKCDTGTESDMEAEKGQFSDAFKRACVKWGIGRFLYALDMRWVDFDQYGKPVDAQGRRIADLTAHIRGLEGLKRPQEAREASEPTVEPLGGRMADQGDLNALSAEIFRQTCPLCGKRHNGTYPKCYDCYKSSRK